MAEKADGQVGRETVGEVQAGATLRRIDSAQHRRNVWLRSPQTMIANNLWWCLLVLTACIVSGTEVCDGVNLLLRGRSKTFGQVAEQTTVTAVARANDGLLA